MEKMGRERVEVGIHFFWLRGVGFLVVVWGMLDWWIGGLLMLLLEVLVGVGGLLYMAGDGFKGHRDAGCE